jgi:hypothetical protein
MKSKTKLSTLIAKMKAANLETVKATAYHDGYLDCIKDILSEDSQSLNELIKSKYDSKIRGEIYSELLPLLESVANEQEIISVKSEPSSPTESTALHPTDRARSFLERINRA